MFRLCNKKSHKAKRNRYLNGLDISDETKLIRYLDSLETRISYIAVTAIVALCLSIGALLVFLL